MSETWTEPVCRGLELLTPSIHVDMPACRCKAHTVTSSTSGAIKQGALGGGHTHTHLCWFQLEVIFEEEGDGKR